MCVFRNKSKMSFNYVYQDQTSSRPNTLSDDADDIQKQLDNEARDRLKYGRPKTVWVFHFPAPFPAIKNALTELEPHRLKKINAIEKRDTDKFEYLSPLLAGFSDWEYNDQKNWYKSYHECGGRSQSPINVPIKSLIKSKGSQLTFKNYDKDPKSLALMNDGKRVVIFGEWKADQEPLITGGAAFSRRYIFHSIILHWPSEHLIGGLPYPLESQVFHISAQYKNMHEALAACSRDKQAVLAISNIYKYSNYTHYGLNDLLKVAADVQYSNATLSPKPLGFFNPPFKSYACYHGSLTSPPCTESVMWLIRANALPVTREAVKAAQDILGSDNIPKDLFTRRIQPVNDRKVYYFD